jgi:thioredoxin reductase (NADPH)
MDKTEVIIVGAGPIGIEFASVLKRLEVPYMHLEAQQIGSTIFSWPRNTRFFSSPERIAIAGVPIQTVHQEQLTGEHYLAYLRGVVELLDLDIRTYERVVDIAGRKGDFAVVTQSRSGKHTYHSNQIVIATGDMSAPRFLGIPGERLPHVTHTFDDPHPYFRKKVLVVGGRNSAIEAAIRCFRSGAFVSVSYRKPNFSKAHVNSRLHLEMSILVRKRKIAFYPETVPIEISETKVVLADIPAVPDGHRGEPFPVPTDFVIFCTGFQTDLSLLRSIGAELEKDEGIPVIDDRTMETSIPGVYLAGTIVSGNRTSDRQFIGTSHHHSERIAKAITGVGVSDVGTIPGRKYPFARVDLELDTEQQTY